jgi:hypothetical protein
MFCSLFALPKGLLVDIEHDTPDRRFWIAYDYLKFEQEARAMRRAEMQRLGRLLWKRLRAALARAGAQPAKQTPAA